MTEGEKKVLLCYRRKSKVVTATDEISIEKQTAAVEIMTAVAGYDVEWYEDAEGLRSGRYEEGRPGWQLLKSQLCRPDVAGIGAYSLSRIYRNLREFLNFLDDMERIGLILLLVKEQLNTETAMGRAIAAILMTIYQLESDISSERRQETIAFLRQHKGRYWGPIPYGCERDEEKQLIPSSRGYWLNRTTGAVSVDEESPGSMWEWRGDHAGLSAVYQVFVDNDLSYARVAEMMNDGGWRVRGRGGPRRWDWDAVRRVLRSWQLYAGDLPVGDIEQEPPRDVLPGGHEAIISQTLTDAVGTKLTTRTRARIRARRAGRVYLLSDVAFCATCGKSLVGRVAYNGKRRYSHSGGKCGCSEVWTLAEAVEQQVMDALVEMLNETLLSRIRAEWEALIRAWRNVGDEEVDDARRELERLEQRLAALVDLYLDGEVDRRVYVDKRREVVVQIEYVKRRLPVDDSDELAQLVVRMEDVIRGLSVDAEPLQKKELVNSLFERIEIAGGRVRRMVPRAWVRSFFEVVYGDGLTTVNTSNYTLMRLILEEGDLT